MTDIKNTSRGALSVVDINRTEDKVTKNLIKTSIARKKTTKEEIFDQVCNNRVGELVDGDEESLKEWSFDDFEYIKKLGAGGTASVFCAREKQSGYEVALKIQPDEGDTFCEFDIHDTLNHRNIVKMIDYFFTEESFGPNDENEIKGTDDDSDSSVGGRNLVMILEFCDGGSLFDFIRDAPESFLTEQQAARFLWNAINALEYVHKKNIIHCDVKSLNFLVTKDGNLKLCDFGMSVKDEEREIVGGSPVYMSPEHLMAWKFMSEDFDNRVDIYCLGILLYEMVVGYLPYEVLDDRDDFDDDDSLVDGFDKLGLDDSGDDLFKPPILDLRKLHDQTVGEPIYIPPPIFPDFVTSSCQDFMVRLAEPNVEKRISLSEAKNHPWIVKHLSEA